jgi:hypothetical protein
MILLFHPFFLDAARVNPGIQMRTPSRPYSATIAANSTSALGDEVVCRSQVQQ